ncbi:reverse transcriptase (RNA-dependent DNA polymerase) domain-containing protein [Phthorimaea operculella]|nr:reverse transcriptase (RNA-dependent DNA polymerase) domain-containing protein [Phthorimaea operculella]
MKNYSENNGDDSFDSESEHLLFRRRAARIKSYAVLNKKTTIRVPKSEESGDEHKAANKKYDYVKILEHLKKTSSNFTHPSPAGPFYNFIVNICGTILTRISSRRTPKYLDSLRQQLKGVGSGFIMKKIIKKLVRNMDTLSRLRGTFGKRFVYKFLEYIMERSPRKDQFFRSMNSIFTAYDDNSFDHYIHDLRRYGDGVIGSTHINLLTEAKLKVDRKSLRKEPGIFQKFLRQFLNMATTAIPEKKLAPFTKTLYKYVNELNYRYTKKLAKRLDKISRMHRDEIQDEYQEFLDMLNAENEPRKQEFLEEMDQVFTRLHESRFNDYIEDMQEYGRGVKLDLNEETRKLVHDVIHNTILGRGHYIMDELENKLKKAMKEQRYSIHRRYKRSLIRRQHRRIYKSKKGRKAMHRRPKRSLSRRQFRRIFNSKKGRKAMHLRPKRSLMRQDRRAYEFKRGKNDMGIIVTKLMPVFLSPCVDEGAPAYNLAKKANAILKKEINIEQHTVKNSIDLINKIKDHTLPQDATLVSFDVKNLFPSIPIDECKSAISEMLIESRMEPQQIIDLQHTISVCLEQNYFTFNNTIYKQNQGLAMGSPLSPICADIYMHMFEKEILRHKVYKENIIYWFRYVDDILCVWNGPKDDINNFLTYINSINPNIQFTVEIGGLKYAPNLPNTAKDLDNLVVDLEVAVTETVTKHLCTKVIREDIKSSSTQGDRNTDIKTIKSIKKKIEQNDLVITKADKGNTVVVTSQQEYNEKVNQFLSGDTFVTLNKDPTAKYNKAVNDTILSANSIFSERDRYLKPMNPSIPRLHGYYKLHKEDAPIRPVVSYTGAPAYNLAKKANAILKKEINIEQHTVKNSIDLINKIKDHTLPQDATLVSFDVKNLFPSIPIDECKSAISEMLIESRMEPQQIIDLQHTISVCLEQNYFTFNNTIYKQNQGLAMGSPLSPICADIYMHMFEKEILRHKVYKENIIYWFRYVDDILCVWNGPKDDINNFLTYINSINPNIQFTVEIGGKELNFLDLTISIIDNRHDFKIYRKPTYTDVVIHANSKHPTSHKHAAFHSMIHRLVSVPMTKPNFDKELNTIKHIANNNGYETHVINKILKKKEKSIVSKLLYKNEINTAKDNKWARIPFLGNISYKCGRLIQCKTPAFYTPVTLKKCLAHKSDSVPINKRSGVYQLECQDCNKIYIGQTGRTFDTRIKEHQRSWRLKKEDSAFAQHLIHENHCFDPATNFRVLQLGEKGRKLNNFEALEINKVTSKKTDILLNEQLDLNRSPLLFYFNDN